MMKKTSLAHIHTMWIQNCTCPLRHSAQSAVIGQGNPFAKVVFIGEAPGKSEDETGLPFVGRAGTLLDELLTSIHMKRENIYITNIVKYRPPHNRDPLPLEKESCRAWLYEELNCIQPTLIVFLGRHAMWNFFPDLSLAVAHGKMLHEKIPGIITEYFLPLYHPAATVYNRRLKEVMQKDFKKIPLWLKKIEKNNTQMHKKS